MKEILVLISLALAPAIYLGIVIYGRDKFDREPKRVLLLAFLLGCLSTLIAAVLEQAAAALGLMSLGGYPGAFVHAFIAVALVEEGSKYFMLRWHAYRHPSFNEPFDGIVYASFVALGFASVENLMYVLQGGWSVALARMFTAVPAHYAFGVMMGYYVGKAKFSPDSEKRLLITGLLASTVLHGAYDFFLIQQELSMLAFATILILIISWRLSNKAIAELSDHSMFLFKTRQQHDEQT